ncbi:MAG: DUF2723 domain-containing protein [Bdellovibrionaceae bacterium]|nr:DUF2723 domain-containing protein [Pseudobdellovibrionaceae bacterium]
MRQSVFWIFLIASSAFIFGTYFQLLPTTVQTGDTAELIAAAKNLFVAHPPGYPLFIWVQHAFIEIFDYGTVFYRASLLNMAFSISCLVCVGWTLKKKRYIAISVVLLLAFSRIFWRYAELPDVFALNSLFACAILVLYFSDNGRRRLVLLMPFIFFLGLTNHHTLIFLLPIVLDTLWRHRADRKIFYALGFGIIGFLALYASMLSMNPESNFSWAELRSVSDLFGHLLRRDYGTFRLISSERESSAWQNWRLLAVETFLSFYPLIAAFVIFGIFRLRFRWARKDKVLLISIVLYAGIFFPMANVAREGILIEVFERFMILFQVLVVLFLGRILVQIKAPRFFEPVLAGIIVLASANQYLLWKGENNFSKNTVVEDYAVNLLREATPGVPTVAIMNGDTRYFSARYVQSILGIAPQVTVIAPKTFFFKSLAAKLVAHSGIKVDLDKLQTSNSADLEADLILPNLDNFEFLTHLQFLQKPYYKLTILSLGRKISKGDGVQIDNSYYKGLQMRTAAADLHSDTRSYDAFRELLSDYGMSPLIQAKNLDQQGKTNEALALFQQTVLNIPWCLPAAAEACRIMSSISPQDKSACEKSLQNLRGIYFDYYN